MTDELNLSGVVDSTAERVLSDSADFQFGLARKLVEASDGELTGTGVAISDNGDGVARVETTFDRARRNLNLARDMNPDQEAAAIRVSAERGLPLPLVRAMDNRDMKQPPDLTSVSPEVVRFLGDDLSHAAVAGDDVENLSGIVDAAECAAMTPEERREELLSTIRREGYSASQLAELKAAGLSPLPDDPEGKSGVFSMDSIASIGATTSYPVLESWYSGPEEAGRLELAKDATDRFREMLRTGFDRVRGSAWLANATPDTAKSYIQTLDREIVTMQGLYALYGESWQEFNDEELSRAVAEVGRALNFDTGAVSIARLRPAGVGWETDWERVFDVFGTVSAYENRTKLSQKELDEVHRNPSGFSQADRMELVDHLESQARALRGRTGWNQAVETVVHTLPYMAQLGGTSAVANIPSVMRTLASGGGLKAVFRTIGRLAVREGIRLGAFVPQRGREMIEETRGQVVPILRDGVILPGMTEDQTSEMADVFFNKMLDTYIENFSEGLGGFFPGTGKLLGPLMRVVPRRLKNAAFVGVAKHVLGDVSRSKGAKIANMVYERSMFNGLLGEYMEEKWGDAIRTVSTELARAVGTKFGDLGQENAFGTVDDELQLMGSLLLTGTVLNTVRIPTAIGDIRRSVQFVDAQRALHTPVESSVTAQRSPETVETLLRYYTRSKDTAYLAPEGARLLYQSAPELLERIGISENVVAESELSGRMIPVSMAKVHTRVSRAELDTLLAKLVPDPGHVLTFEDAKNVDLSAEAQRVAEDTDRVRAETKAAYDEAIQKMMKLNRPASEIRAVAKLLSMANYFDAESDMSAADFIRGIDFQSMGFQEWLAQQSAGAELRLTQEALSYAVRQKFGSGATSLRQVAAGFKKIDFAPGTVNLDLGGGKFDEGTKYLAERGVTNLVYDPVNRSSGENWKIYDAVRNGGVDTVTCNNVLNVIGEAEVRDNVILQAAKALKPGGVAYFTVYEGDGSGKGRQSKADSWQEHRKTKTYVGEVERHFGSVSLRNGVIEARDPITGEKVSAWFNDGLSASPSLFQSEDFGGSPVEYAPKDARFYFQAVGDKFRAIRDALPEETGATPLFGKRFSSVKQILPALAEIFNRFPDSVTAADGKKVLIKNPDGGSVAKRLMHLIAGADENSGDRNSFEFSNKIAWIPRIVETVENAQVKLRDPQTGNYAYVRSYSEGVIHSVVVTKNGVVADTETFDHGLITQFAAKYAGRRGEFTVVWERTDGGPSSAPTSANGSQGNDPSALTSKEEGGKQSPQSPSTGESNGDAPYSPSAETNIAPSLKNVKLLQGDEIPRGATTFNDAWEATITLFEETADASTLIHELGHYATEMMRHLVESGAAGERMQRDYATLMEWAAKGESDFVMQREKLARAFEAYCMEGRAPSIELEGAFATLRRLLLHIYRSVKALGVELSSEVRSVFDGMLATDETMREDSIIREAAMEINKELLGLSQPEIRTFRELIEKANDQAVQQLTEEKNAQIAKLRPQWRKEAEILMEGDPVYKAYRIIRKDGGIDYTALEEISGAAAAEELRRRGLATGKRSRGKHPAALAAESGFVTVEEMVDRLSSEKAPREFIADYLADAERRFNEGFEASESALSVNASIDALEKLSELLAVKGGRKGFSLRRALLRRRALEEIDGMPVRDVVGDRKLIGDCRMNARKLTQAANAGDFATALEAAQHLRYNLELLRMKGDAKKAVLKLERQLSRARHAKKGRIFGDHQRALQDLSYRFGFTRSAPSLPGDATVQSVIDEYNSEAGMNGDAPLDVPAWIMNATASCRDLTFADFRTLSMVAEFLDGEGRALVGAREAAFRNEVKASIEKCVSELSVRKHKFIRGGAGAPLRRAAQWGTKLRNIMGQAGRWNPESEFLKLYDDMNFAESENFILQTGPLREVSAALDILYRETRGIDLRNLPSFPEDVAAEAYHSWDAEKLVACCLNMGNAGNRQRLRDGFQWEESDLDLIASRLSRAGWEQIQRIWDAIGKGELADRARQTFKDEYHFDLRIEEPTPFSVTTADGVNLEMEGGYYPLEYLFHRNSVVEDRKAIGHAFPVYRRASFTFERNKKSSDPLRLSLRVAQSHIYDVSHYISHRRTMRKVLRVVNDHTFRTHFCRTQGFERYDALRALVQNVATPDAMREAEHWIDTLGRPLVTAAGLWGNLSVAAMQLSSVTVGVDELGSYYLESMFECASHPERARALVMAKSGMMRDRLNMKDLDLRVRVNRFSEGMAAQVRRDLIEAGYWGMRQVDMAVATPAWIGAYNKALDDGKNERRAVAAADEFVAKTQGAARPIDLSPIQLSAIGRGVTIFFSATSAVATTATRTLSRIAVGDLRGGAAAAGLMANCIAPFLLAALIRYALAGSDDDDPDKARRAFLRELIVSPFSGIPLVRDFADSAAALAVGQRTGGRQAIFENAGLRGLNDVGSAAYGAIAALADENVDRALYKCVELAGTMLQIPIVTAWNRARRILENFGVDDLPDMEKETRKR